MESDQTRKRREFGLLFTQLAVDALIEALTDREVRPPNLHVLESSGPDSFLKAVRRIRESGSEAVVCYDDKTALNLIDTFRRIGTQVPDDIAVTGFDDIPFARISNPGLTTVAQPVEAMARLAVDMLVSALEDGELPTSVSIPVTLVVRESTSEPGHLRVTN